MKPPHPSIFTAVAVLAASLGLMGPALAQNITCTDRVCRGTDIMGNPVLLEVQSNRLDRTQRYTARVGDQEITVERTRSPLVAADWYGPVLLDRPTTHITGQVAGYPVDLQSNGSGLITGTAFGKTGSCAVDGWSVYSSSPCF